MLKIFGTLFLLMPFVVLAQGSDRGGSDGGGGNGVVCYNPANKNEILSVDLLDFYEGSILEGYEIGEKEGSHEEIYKEVSKRGVTKSIQEFLKGGLALRKGFKFLPQGVRLRPVHDSSEIFIPANCKVEQLANFQGPSRIFIVTDFWNFLSETEKAGLLMHEYLWMMERAAGIKNSARARRNVARFFADNYTFNSFSLKPKAGDMVCHSKFDMEGPLFQSATSFIIKPTDDPEVCHLSFHSINGSMVFTETHAELYSCSNFRRLQTDAYSMEHFVEVFEGESSMPSYDIGLKSQVLREGDTVKQSRFFRTKSLEFPGYSDPQAELFCMSVSEQDIEISGWWWNWNK